MPGYNDRLLPEEQVDAEEWIATKIFDHPGVDVSEDAATTLSRDILLMVLAQFRPDLVEKDTPSPEEPRDGH